MSLPKASGAVSSEHPGLCSEIYKESKSSVFGLFENYLINKKVITCYEFVGFFPLKKIIWLQN